MSKIIRVMSILLAIVMMSLSFSLGASALFEKGKIYVNGAEFNGTVSEAIMSAGENGLVEISGTVYTYPIGKRDGCFVNNVTISGKNNAKLLLDLRFVMHNDDNLDVLTIKGKNVTVKDLYIDATYRVDYAICIFPGTDNLKIENVEACRGIRGGINVMTDGHVSFENVQANYGVQTGFEFENCNGTNITFENCSSKGSWYKVGLIIKNGYSDCVNIDAAGITCYEDCFAFHDRVNGTISGGERAKLSLLAPPKNSSGEPINTDFAMYYPLEDAYQHLRFGITEKKLKTAVSYVDSTAYGINTRFFFDDEDIAEQFVHDGESVLSYQKVNFLFNFFARLFDSLRIDMF